VAFGGASVLFQLVALGLPAAGSVEAPIPIRIDFDAPADCSTGEAFYQGVRSRTDRVRRAETGESGTELGVRVTKTPGKVHGELDLIGEHGESDRRVVDGETCDEVVEALSLTAALALDPTARVTPVAVPPEPSTAPRPVAAPCPSPPEPVVSPNAFELAVRARAVAALVVRPYASFGASAGASVRPVSLSKTGPSFGFAVEYLGNDVFGEPEGALVHTTIVVLSACPLRPKLANGFFIEPCLTGKGGWIEAEGKGLTNPDWAIRSWWSLGAEVAVELELGGGFATELAPRLDVPIVKRNFTTGEPPEALAETPAVSPGVGVGIGYYFQ
jgi:hypothetical protein